jgi:pSer/pThr/pTyr-binding forkhead associated (FHA) protein
MGTSPSAARLEVMSGSATGMSIVVDDELVIGRHAEGPGRLADDEEISRTHARITVDAAGYCAIEDLGSTNGTLVNGLRISAPQVLSVGDTIELGLTTLSVKEVPTPVALEEPARVEDSQPTVVPGAAHQPPVAGPQPVPPVAAEPPPPRAVTGEPPPSDEPTAATPPALPPLSLRLEVDFAASEARLLLSDDSELVRLVFDGRAWRSAATLLSEKGDAV